MTRSAPRSQAAELELPGLVRDRVREGRAKAAATRARRHAEAEIAEESPVARVLVDVPLAHLDRPFDYAVPVAMAADARPGVRVKVRFAGQDVDGFLLARTTQTTHQGRLQPLRRVVSAEPVLSPKIADLAAEVAERYAGTRADVLRLAVPPRHATTEKEPSPPAGPAEPWTVSVAASAWAGHDPAEAYLHHLADGGSPRAVWQAAAGSVWPLLLAHAVAATAASGRGALVVVPDGKDVARLDAALRQVLGEGRHVALTADAGPARRYRDFLAVSRGAVKVAVGTRAAAFAPVHDLGLVALWDDGDDALAEPRAPYPHAREVLLLRAEREGAAALVGGFARTVEADHLVRAGWAHQIRPTRALARERLTVAIAGASDFDLERDPFARVSRVPREAHETIRAGVATGPVLLQTPRRGYAAALACETCRAPARCGACRGPLHLTGATTPPECGWCGRVEEAWTCAACGGRGLRAPVLGDARTAEELGRIFPGVPVVTSSGERVRASVPDRPAIVVATPGAEPVAERGYAAVLLLDTWLLLGRPDLRTDEEALRRWSNAVGLVRPGGRALAVGDPALPALQALLRWDQPGFARREAEARAEAHLPPASRLATITGEAGAVDDALTLLALPAGGEVLGPVPHEGGRDSEEWRAVVRAPRAHATALSSALGELQRVRSARKLDPVRVQVDPPSL
ncbi:primosomal protein N' [Nocardioides sp. DS6]|uniref:Probable replication restart protein PriA n=1 Tax=Nocardioides eburneus TaxID=3231482 RepID=A0ABV3T216_9ACTN